MHYFNDEEVSAYQKTYYFPSKIITIPYVLALLAINIGALVIQFILVVNLSNSNVPYAGTIVYICVSAAIIGALLFICLCCKII